MPLDGVTKLCFIASIQRSQEMITSATSLIKQKGKSPHGYVTYNMFCSNDLLDIFILLTSFRVQCLA